MKSGLPPVGGRGRSGPQGSHGRAEMATGLGAGLGGSGLQRHVASGEGVTGRSWSGRGRVSRPHSLPFPERQGGPATLLGGRNAKVSVGLREAVVSARSPEGPPHSWVF